MQNREIIIPMFAGIGNGLIAVPMVRQLKQLVPEAQIVVLAGNAAIGEVFQRQDAVRGVILFEPGMIGMLKTGMALHRRRAALLLIPSPSRRWQYRLLAACSGSRRKIMHCYGPEGSLTAKLFSIERKPAQRGLHDVQQNLLLLETVRPECKIDIMKIEPPAFPLHKADRLAAETLLRNSGYSDPDRSPVIVHAGSAATALAGGKRWPARQYGALLHELNSQLGDRIILVEGPDEQGVAAEILKTKPELQVTVVPLRGGLGVAAALLERAELYVGSDSGLAHLAAAVGTPPVTLFGPSEPDRVCPYGYRHLVVQSRRETCMPCYGYPWREPYPRIDCKKGFACMRDITVQDVMEAVRVATHGDMK